MRETAYLRRRARRRYWQRPDADRACGPSTPRKTNGRRMNLDPSLGLPVVYLVDDEDMVRDALT
jgi:hypothetical protein